MNRVTSHPLSLTRLFGAIQGNLEQRAYSPQTIKDYLGQLRNLVRDINLTNPQHVSGDDIRTYLAGLVTEGKSISTVDQAYNALSYFYKAVYNHDLILDGFKRPRKKKLKPVMLTVSEVRKIAVSAENLKHRLMIELAYTAGLRVSELVAVKVQHVSLEKLMLFVPGLGKLGTRTTIFSASLKDALQRQIGNKKPGDYLFPSEQGGKLTTRSVTKFFKVALTSSGVEKQATRIPSASRSRRSCWLKELIVWQCKPCLAEELSTSREYVTLLHVIASCEAQRGDPVSCCFSYALNALQWCFGLPRRQSLLAKTA